MFAIEIQIERNAPHMAYEGIPHICICGTITWGERVSGMWGPPSLSPCDCATWGKYEGNPHMPYEVHFSHSIYVFAYIISCHFATNDCQTLHSSPSPSLNFN